MDTHEEQDAFVNLREEFMERTSMTTNSMTLSLAIEAGGNVKEMMINHPPNELGLFSHTVQTKANSVKFTHQSFCRPRITMFLKAIQRGFLKGCPNLSAKGVM